MSALYYGGFSSVFSFLTLPLLALFLSGRSDADRSTKRPYMMYLDGVLLVGIVAFVVSLSVAVGSVGHRLFSDTSSALGDPEFTPSSSSSNGTWRTIIVVICILIPVTVLLKFHADRRSEIRSQADFFGSAHARTDRVFVYAVCFLSVVLLAVSLPLALTRIVSAVAPGIMAANRSSALADLLTLTIPLFGSMTLLRTFWKQAADDRIKAESQTTGSETGNWSIDGGEAPTSNPVADGQRSSSSAPADSTWAPSRDGKGDAIQ
jgi:hypothetical protein